MGDVPNPIVSYITANLSSSVSAVTSGMTTVVGTIKDEPILLLAVAVPFVGACIGLAKRLFSFGGGRGR